MPRQKGCAPALVACTASVTASLEMRTRSLRVRVTVLAPALHKTLVCALVSFLARRLSSSLRPYSRREPMQTYRFLWHRAYAHPLRFASVKSPSSPCGSRGRRGPQELFRRSPSSFREPARL
uniref:Uncharacterized protein n=1 Tax=Hyaloperonospora arabidopsidis (strain Emoy2) TaxID=559515 RepID=M4B548_HYAAE